MAADVCAKNYIPSDKQQQKTDAEKMRAVFDEIGVDYYAEKYGDFSEIQVSQTVFLFENGEYKREYQDVR